MLVVVYACMNIIIITYKLFAYQVNYWYHVFDWMGASLSTPWAVIKWSQVLVLIFLQNDQIDAYPKEVLKPQHHSLSLSVTLPVQRRN